MKKALCLLIVATMVFAFCGCDIVDVAQAVRIQTINDWSFQYNSGTNDYSLFFCLRTKSGTDVAASADVDIRIENDEGETVYQGVHHITENDFGHYSNVIRGEHYMADIRIPQEDIKPGKSDEGTAYFTVSGEYISFDECNCDISSGLPIEDYYIDAGELPVEVNYTSYWGVSTFRIDSISVDKKYEWSSTMTVTVSGEKIYGTEKTIEEFNYKIYDEEGYVIDSGTAFLDDLSEGDKFREEILLYDIVPGVHYTIMFYDYSY